MGAPAGPGSAVRDRVAARREDECPGYCVAKLLSGTRSVETPNRQLRKVLKTRGHMPNEQAALKRLTRDPQR